MAKRSYSICLAIYGISGKGGAEKSVIWLANALKAQGHAPYILVHRETELTESAFPLSSGIPVKSVELFAPKTANVLTKLQLKLTKWLGKNLFKNLHYFWYQKYKSLIEGYRHAIEVQTPDLVLAYLPITFTYVAEAMKDMNKPLIIANRNDPERDFSLARNKSSKYDLQARFKSVEYDFSINCVQIEPFKTFFSSEVQNKTIVIPNHVKPFEYSIQECKEARAPKIKSILNVASLSPKKNQDMLIQAFASLVAKHPDWQLVIVGGGKQEHTLKALVRRLDISDKVKFEGIQENVDEYYRKASIFAFPSLYEGLSNALLEAMSSGLPSVVLEECNSNHFLISDSNSGVSCQSEPKDLAKGLEQLILDPALRLEKGHNARQYTKQFTEKRTYSLWEHAIEQAINTISQNKI